MTLLEFLSQLGIKKIQNGKISYSHYGPTSPEKILERLLNLPEVRADRDLGYEVLNTSPEALLDLVSGFLPKKGSTARPVVSGRPGEVLEASTESVKYIMTKCVPFIDRENESKIAFYEPERNKVIKISPKVYMANMGIGLAELYNTAMLGLIRFDPTSEKVIDERETDGEKIAVLNTYVPPLWVSRTPTDPSRIPPLLEKFFKHLLPEEKSLMYFFGWMQHAIVSRNDTILCMIGEKGVGKSIASNIVAKGTGNSFKSDDAFLKEKFTASELNGNKLLILDEVTVNDKAKEKLKRVTNSEVKSEAKGGDPETIRNFVSFIITNNHLDGMKLESDDRRFSIIELTTTPLLKVMSEEEVSEIGRLSDAPIDEEPCENTVNFFHWLMRQDFSEHFDNNKPFKGKYYHEIVYKSLPQSQKTLVDLIMANPWEEMSLQSFKKKAESMLQVKNIRCNMDDMQKFLSVFRYDGKYKVAEVVLRSEGPKMVFYFIPDPEFKKFCLDRLKSMGASIPAIAEKEATSMSSQERLREVRNKINNQEEISGEDLL